MCLVACLQGSPQLDLVMQMRRAISTFAPTIFMQVAATPRRLTSRIRPETHRIVPQIRHIVPQIGRFVTLCPRFVTSDPRLVTAITEIAAYVDAHVKVPSFPGCRSRITCIRISTDSGKLHARHITTISALLFTPGRRLLDNKENWAKIILLSVYANPRYH